MELFNATMGKYKKATAPVEKVVREAVIDKKALDIINAEIKKNKVVSTAYLASRANIRISAIKKYMESLVAKGEAKPLAKGFGQHYIIIGKEKGTSAKTE